MEYILNNGAGGGARLGLIVLATDETLEFEARQVVAGQDVQLLHARIPMTTEITTETLARMEVDLPRTAELLPQGLDAIGYGCTSASTVIGADRVAACIRQPHEGVEVSNPISAVIAALGHLGASRIGMVTPYVPEVTAPMVALLGDSGIEVVREIGFAEGDDWRVARIDPASTRAALLEVAKTPGVEALFASCTNLQTFAIIDEVEALTGLPVVTSNQALVWHLLRLAGVNADNWGPGLLFRR